MGKKRQRFTWPEAKKRCRLNQLEIQMAKRLGFSPDALIHAIPSPKQKWKLPVKYWVHELHEKKFGHVLGRKEFVDVPPRPLTPNEEAEEAHRLEEEIYREDYLNRNSDDPKRKSKEAVCEPGPPPTGVDDSDWLSRSTPATTVMSRSRLSRKQMRKPLFSVSTDVVDAVVCLQEYRPSFWCPGKIFRRPGQELPYAWR